MQIEHDYTGLFVDDVIRINKKQTRVCKKGNKNYTPSLCLWFIKNTIRRNLLSLIIYVFF